MLSKVILCIQLNEYMKLNEIKGQGHSLILAKGHIDFKIKLVFLRNCFFKSNLFDSLWEHGNGICAN